MVKFRRNLLPGSRGVAPVQFLKPPRQDVWKDRSFFGVGQTGAAICAQMMGTSTLEQNTQQLHGGCIATGHTPTLSHVPAFFRVGVGGGGGLGLRGHLGPAEGEGGTRTPTYTA